MMASLEVNPSFGAAALAAKTEAGRTAGWLNFRQTRDGKTNGQDHYRTTPIDPEHHTRVHGPPYDALPPCTTPHPTVQRNANHLTNASLARTGAGASPHSRAHARARAAPHVPHPHARDRTHNSLVTFLPQQLRPPTTHDPPRPTPPHPLRCQSKRVIYGSS